MNADGVEISFKMKSLFDQKAIGNNPYIPCLN